MKRTLIFLRKYKMGIICALAVVLCYLVMFALGISCPIKHLTGVSCAGCGMTRACLAALRLDFSAAFAYHPLWVVLLPSAALLAYLAVKRRKRAFFASVAVIAVLFCGVYLYRLFFLETDIVTFSPENGVIFRMLGRT